MCKNCVTNEWIDAPPPKQSPYWADVRARAKELQSDGCTDVPDFYVEACFEHDIHWRTGLTLEGKIITTAQANRRFRKVIQSRSPLHLYSPLSWWRYAGVTIAGHFLKHASK